MLTEVTAQVDGLARIPGLTQACVMVLVEPQAELQLSGPSGYTSRAFYFKPREGDEVKDFGVYNNKYTDKKTKECPRAERLGDNYDAHHSHTFSTAWECQHCGCLHTNEDQA